MSTYPVTFAKKNLEKYRDRICFCRKQRPTHTNPETQPANISILFKRPYHQQDIQSATNQKSPALLPGL
jgi:hypothetical protein